jgi:hypothetical protein
LGSVEEVSCWNMWNLFCVLWMISV